MILLNKSVKEVLQGLTGSVLKINPAWGHLVGAFSLSLSLSLSFSHLLPFFTFHSDFSPTLKIPSSANKSFPSGLARLLACPWWFYLARSPAEFQLSFSLHQTRSSYYIAYIWRYDFLCVRVVRIRSKDETFYLFGSPLLSNIYPGRTAGEAFTPPSNSTEIPRLITYAGRKKRGLHVVGERGYFFPPTHVGWSRKADPA